MFAILFAFANMAYLVTVGVTVVPKTCSNCTNRECEILAQTDGFTFFTFGGKPVGVKGIHLEVGDVTMCGRHTNGDYTFGLQVVYQPHDRSHTLSVLIFLLPSFAMAFLTTLIWL